MLEELKVLKQGLQIVANNCDGAIDKDGTGFAKNDLGYGNFLSNTDPGIWIDGEIYNACKLFRKYKKQHGLLNQGMENFTSNILINDLSNEQVQEAKAKYQDFINQKYKRVVKEAKPVVKKLAQFFNNKVIIGFPYNQDLLTDLKVTCKTKKYNPENKTWELEILTETEYKALLSFLGKYEFEIEGEYIPLKSEELLNRFNGKVTYLSNTKLEISFSYDEELLKDLKKLDMFKKYNRENKIWEFFNLITDNVLKVVEFGKKWNLEIDTQILDFLEIQNKEVKEVAKVEGKVERLEKYQVKYSFASHYQLEALDWVLQKKKIYIGDTMGLGKTLETLISIDYTDKKAVVFCPNSLKYNWGLEIEKFVKNRSYQILTSKNKTIDTIEDKDIYILNYDIIEKLLPVLKQINFDFLVLDEAHMVKESKTKRFKAIKELLETKNPEYRVLLSGTCITNRPKELVPQLEILGVLHKIVDKPWNFFMRYCGAYRTNFGWDMSGASHTQELHSKLTETCYIRREKEQVLKDLPEKRRNNIYLEISNRKEYNQALNDLITYLREEKDKEINTNAQHLVQIEVLKQLVAKGKLEAVKEWIDNVLANDEKLVIFGHHKEIIKELKIAYPTALIIDGGTSVEDRQLAVNEFQNNIDKKLMICSIKSASVGLTLTASSNVAFIELPWTPAELDQAEDRCHRRGQLNNVNAYYLLGKNTIEDSKIMPLIENKRAVFNAVARGEKVKRKDLESSILNDLVDSLIA